MIFEGRWARHYGRLIETGTTSGPDRRRAPRPWPRTTRAAMRGSGRSAGLPWARPLVAGWAVRPRRPAARPALPWLRRAVARMAGRRC